MIGLGKGINFRPLKTAEQVSAGLQAQKAASYDLEILEFPQPSHNGVILV
jgi:hypothetical protein